MRFLDPKEEVFKIQLTPYGVYLLSQGHFDPTYYAFFDDDILYDSSYLSGSGNTTELQNSIEDRILNQTPRFEGQTSFEGSDATVFAKEPNLLEEIFPGIGKKLNDPSYSIEILEKPVSQYMLQNPIARSAYHTDKAPFYNLQMITGAINSVSTVGVSGSGYSGTGDTLDKNVPTTFIDQINIDLYNTINKNRVADGVAPTANIQDDELFDAFYVFEDGSSITYDKKRIFIKLEEGNTQFMKENFDIEIFDIIEQTVDDEKTEQLKKFSFTEDNKEPTAANVEYYFNLKLDNEIEDSYYCEALKDNPNKTKDIFSDKTFRCPEQKQELINVNIYNTDQPEDPDTGDC